MRVLLLTSAFAPVVTAHSERAVSLARLLRGAGHEVHVARLDTEYAVAPHGYDAADFADGLTLVETGVHRQLKSRRILRLCRLGLDVATAAPGPFVYEARRMYRVLLKDPALHSCDVVWVTTPPHELQLVGYWLSERKGIPYVMDLRDPWGDSTRIRWITPWQRRMARRWYHRCLAQAAAVVTNTPCHYQLIHGQQRPSVQGKLYQISNGYFEADFARAESSRSAPTGLPVLAYAGGLYGGQVEGALATLYEAGRQRGVSFRVRMVGAASGAHPFEYVGLVSPAHVAQEIVAADWLFLYMPQSAATGPVMSLKAYQYARSGKPVLYMGPKNETYAYLAKHSVLVDFDDPGQALGRLLELERGGRCRARAEIAAQDSWEAKLTGIERMLEASQQRGARVDSPGVLHFDEASATTTRQQ